MVLLATLAFAPDPVGASGSVGEALVEYDLGSAFAGRATGTCDAVAVFLAPSIAGGLTVAAAGGEWLRHVVSFNYTEVFLPGEGPRHVPLSSDLWQERSLLTPGTARIEWTAQGRLDVYGAPGPLGPETHAFGAAFDTSRLAAGKVTDGTPTVTTYEDVYGVPSYVFGALTGPHRVVDVADGILRLSGALTLYLEDATVAWEGGPRHGVPAHYETVSAAGAPGTAMVRQSRVHYAFLTLHEARIDVEASRVTLACVGLGAHLDGALTAYLARGRLDVGAGPVEFEERELKLGGSFTWSETPQGLSTRATGSGSFDHASLDFVPVQGGGDAWGVAAQVGFWGALVAAVGAALYWASKLVVGFFSRLNENQVVTQGSRRLVLDAVRANPNVTLRGLTHATGLSKSEVRYHARVLEQHRVLRSHKVHRDRCFVARETLRREGRGLLEARPEVVARNDPVVGALLRCVPPQGIRLNPLLVRVSAEVGISRPGAWKAVRRAQRYGMVTRWRVGREVWVRCAE